MNYRRGVLMHFILRKSARKSIYSFEHICAISFYDNKWLIVLYSVERWLLTSAFYVSAFCIFRFVWNHNTNVLDVCVQYFPFTTFQTSAFIMVYGLCWLFLMKISFGWSIRLAISTENVIQKPKKLKHWTLITYTSCTTLASSSTTTSSSSTSKMMNGQQYPWSISSGHIPYAVRCTQCQKLINGELLKCNFTDSC